MHQALLDEDLVVEQKPASSRPVSDTPATGFALSSWFRPAAGMAVAASVALVMVVTLSGEENPATVPLAKSIDSQPVAVEPVQLAVEHQPASKEATSIAPHLVDHHLEYATQDTFQGRLPYVRAVSYQKKTQ